MARRRPIWRSSSSTAACWACRLKEAGWTQAPSQAALGVSGAWRCVLAGGNARADTVRAPTRPASSSSAVALRESRGNRKAPARGWREWRGAGRNVGSSW